MIRVTKSLVIGGLVVVALFTAVESFDRVVVSRGTDLPFIERNPYGWLLQWPLPFLKSIFPPEAGTMTKLSAPGIVVAFLCNILLYSLPGYMVLWWRTRRRRLA